MKAYLPFNTIHAGLADRVFADYAPTGATYPFIIYQNQDPPRDVRGVGPARVMVDTLYVVKAIMQAKSFFDLAPIANGIDIAMTQPQGATVVDGTILSSIREQQFSLVEIDQGKQFRHLGNEYRIQAQAT